jgi:hypothetical protein
VIAVFDRLLAWLGSLFDRRGETDERDGDDSRFVPSPLDRSVRRAHGSGGEDAARELERVDEQAQELDPSRRRD